MTTLTHGVYATGRFRTRDLDEIEACRAGRRQRNPSPGDSRRSQPGPAAHATIDASQLHRDMAALGAVALVVISDERLGDDGAYQPLLGK